MSGEKVLVVVVVVVVVGVVFKFIMLGEGGRQGRFRPRAAKGNVTKQWVLGGRGLE